MPPRELLVIGGGGHAAEVCSYIHDLAAATASIKLLGCVDERKPPGQYGPVIILGGFEVLEKSLAHHDGPIYCITAVGDNQTRHRLVERVEAIGGDRIVWSTVTHPAATIGHDVQVGPGTCLAPGTVVTARARVGAHSILNIKASVSHDAFVGEYSNLNPGATVAGNTRLGTGCYVGAGATIIQNLTVGDWCVLGAGTVVIRDLPSRVTAVGVPARIIKHH